MFDATFWVAISFVIFCLIIVYKKIPQVINNLLDNKINEIKSEIDNAKNLKNESEQLLKKYKKKIEDAHMEKNHSANDEKMKVINQKNLEKIFINLTNTKAS
ncbi:MAG: hypothetical protein EBX25_00365 [Candidatus Fonsibacter ubiquis]|nr:hypothetical protein [Candidatus Fonsibacter ubiquis]